MGSESRHESPPLVRLEEIRKSYGELLVLDGVSLDVSTGQRLGIIGTSGSGKSTLLRLVMGLEQPDSGTINIDGNYLWHEQRNGELVSARRRHVRRVRGQVGMIFQHFNLFPHMTVRQNVTDAPVHVLGVSRTDARERADQLLSTVGLREKADSYPGELSGGQKQRVAIARALAMDPKVLLLDEVTSALDPELVVDVQSVLRDLAKDSRMTFMVVSHDMPFVREFTQRVVFLDGGRILEDSDTDHIFEEPLEERTQEFLKLVLERQRE